MKSEANQTEQLIAWLHDYARTRINSLLIDERRCIPPHIFLDFGNQGLLGLYVPKQYGGLELPTHDILRILEQLAAIDMSLAVVVNDSILSAYTLLHSSNQAAKERYLPQIASGRILMANAITEPAAGSDPRKIEATATPDGKGGWLLNGTKLWVGSASWSTVMSVFVKQLDEQGRVKDITGFLVSTDAPGVTIGHESLSLGMKGFVKNTVTLRNVRVNATQLLGEPGTGMASAQATMQYIRMCLGMICVGSAKRCIQLMHRYSSRRPVATGLLLDNPVTQVRISNIITEIAVIDTFITHTAQLLDAGHRIPEEIFIICKNVASDVLATAVDSLIQTLGARGYEENNIAAKIFRDARPFRIFEGPNEVLDMYLGSKVLNQNLELHNFIKQVLGMPALSEQLLQLTKSFEQQLINTKQGLFASIQKTQYWAYSCMSKVATDLLMMAILEKVCQQQMHDETLQHALRWMQAKCELSLQNALQINLTEKALLTIPHIHRIVNCYRQNIGDIEQRLPGENVELDPLLKINPEIVPEEQLAAEQWQQVLYAWNNTHQEFPSDLTIVQLFSIQAAKTPHKIAVSSGNNHLSYQELEQRSTQLAIHLQQLNVKEQDIIGIYLPRCTDAIIALLAVLKSGAAYLPLDPNYPQERLQYMLHDSGASLVITQQQLMNKLTDATRKVICIDTLQEQYNHQLLHVPTGTRHLAYVIYTSGSTGQPKGVMIEHRSLTNLVYHAVHAYSITPEDRVLQFASLSFDAAIEEIYPALVTGAELILRSEEMLNSSESFLHAVKQLEVSVLDLPTAYWHQLVTEAPTAWLACKLRLVILGGEKIQPAQLKRWVDNIGADIRLVNTYGPTETTVIATSAELSIEAFQQEPVLPIGRPIANTKAYVLNQALNPVPIGVIGELYIGGLGVARGYLNQPTLTAERFIMNPFTDDGTKLYRTGDRVYYRDDGQLEFIGRVDHQVKVRGFRVELSEIHTAIIEFPGIQQAHVLAKPDNSANNQIIAYIVTEQPIAEFLPKLRAAMTKRLPNYMLPSHYQIVEHLPLTSNGKINEKALPSIDQAIRILPANFKKAASATETQLASIWENCLRIAPIGIDENFVELGGHSLLATQIVGKIKQQCNVELSIHHLFQYPTIHELARYIDLLSIAMRSTFTAEDILQSGIEVVEL